MTNQGDQQAVLFPAQEQRYEIEEPDLKYITGGMNPSSVVSKDAKNVAQEAFDQGKRATLIRSGSGNHVISWAEYQNKQWPTPTFRAADTIGPEMVGLPTVSPGKGVPPLHK
jgi:hypothetical protein